METFIGQAKGVVRNPRGTRGPAVPGRPGGAFVFDTRSLEPYYPPLMSGGLPAFIDPVRLAELGRSLAGRLPLERMRRLGEVLADRRGEVEVRLEFREEGRGRAVVRGRIGALLRLTCQRCLEPFDFAVDVPVHLVVVGSDAQAQRLAEEEDPLLVGEGQTLSLTEMVEDELLLALPQVPAHPPPCGGGAAWPEVESEREPSPFASLRTSGGGE